MNRPITRADRRALDRTNAKLPVMPTEVPREHWPTRAASEQDRLPLRVLRSRDYLIQVFKAEPPALVRISVNRTKLDARQDRWVEGITWDELQWIKNVIGYHDRDAVEVYPPTWDEVNVANMRHLWVLDGMLTFPWRKERVMLAKAAAEEVGQAG